MIRNRSITEIRILSPLRPDKRFNKKATRGADMVHQPHKQTPYDQFNFEIPQKFPKEGISATAANAIVNS